MTWKEANLSLQLLAEERVGRLLRANAAEIAQQQDAASAGLRKMVG